MNDFTKEELIMLKRLTLHHVNQFRQNSDCIELMSKIQSIIDRYCEHNWAFYLSSDGSNVKCHKCNKEL